MGVTINNSDTSLVHLLKRAFHTILDEGVRIAFEKVVWKLARSRFELRRKALLSRRHGSSMIRLCNNDFELHPSMNGVSEELTLYGVHEPVSTRIYLDQMSPGDHVIDIGCNLGYFVILSNERIGRTGRILGFEPSPLVFNILKRNLDRAGITNIDLFPWAIGAKSESVYFYESEIPNWGSLRKDENLKQTHSIPVESKSLDEVVMNMQGFRPGFIRMDVEGGELDILEGAKEILKKYKPCLFIEFHNKVLGWDSVRQAIVNLQKVGYNTGFLIERVWDHPWIHKWIREQHYRSGSIKNLLEILESSPLKNTIMCLILKA